MCFCETSETDELLGNLCGDFPVLSAINADRARAAINNVALLFSSCPVVI